MCPDFSEGVLSKLRGQLVSRSELSRLADVLGLDHFILVGKGESSQKIYSEKESIKADVFESYLAIDLSVIRSAQGEANDFLPGDRE